MDRLELVQLPARAASGGRPPLLFVHGICHAAWCWSEHYLPHFAAQGWDVSALSLRGHGASDGREALDGFGLEDYVDDVLAQAARLPRPPVLIGHSMGGAIAQLALRRAASQLAGAVLLAPMPPDGLTVWEQLRLYGDPGAMMAVRQLLSRPPLTPRQVYRLPFFCRRLSLERCAKYAALLQPESTRAIADLGALAIGPQRFDLPLLVLGSRRDALFARSALERTAAHNGCPAVVLERGCHDLMLDPEWRISAEAIRAWLEGHWR